MNVGIASIKRWEAGQIQTRVMDDTLRGVLTEKEVACDPYSGNRPLSLSRIKLVITRLGQFLKPELLTKRKDDRMLYAAKYLWYADMIAFRETGQGMTGATYAALPHGPQLNNYAELLDRIREANETEAEPLTESEERVLTRIALTLPTDKAVHDAVHNERIWKDKKIGALIPYTDVDHIKAM